MTATPYSRIARHATPGEVRAALLDQSGRPCRLFVQRWNGVYDHARCGASYPARLRSFADDIRGAFLELEGGEEVFLRLKTRDGFTEGMKLVVAIMSEARSDKLARVRTIDQTPQPRDAFEVWQHQFPNGEHLDIDGDPDAVMAAFDEASAASITLPKGGHLHLDRTRALTACDVDTAGRTGKGSAAAKALAINREAICEAIRQMALRGLGGNLVLDCVGPLNKQSAAELLDTAQSAMSDYGFTNGKALAPSSLGLMELSLPWTVKPLEDLLNERPAETELLALLRDTHREAEANRSAFFEVRLSKSVWQAYLDRKTETDAALKTSFSGRVSLAQSQTEQSRVQRL